MNRLRRVTFGGGFALLVAGIWLRHPLGEAAAELWPALAAFPLYGWLAGPWAMREQPGSWAWRGVAIAGAVLLVGAALDQTLILAFGAVALWRAWLATEVAPGASGLRARWLWLLVCGFPWLGLEGQAIGWWFRYSGAWAAAGIFDLVGFAVQREGTLLTVQGLPLAVDEACSGLHALQALLEAGTVLALLRLPGRQFWVGVALLPGLAWAANLARIVTLGVAGLSFGRDAALGWFHAWGGWGVLMAMFVLCSGAFQVLAKVGQREVAR